MEEGKPFFFVLNQVDRIEPFEEWDKELQEPSAKQFQNMYRKIDVVSQFFQIGSSKIIPISANKHYGLTQLVDEIIYALPKEKQITMFRQVSNEYKSDAAGDHVKQSWLEVVGDVICDVVGAVADAVTSVFEAAHDFWEDIKPRWWPF